MDNPFVNYVLSSEELGSFKLWRLHPARVMMVKTVKPSGPDPLREMSEEKRKRDWSQCVEVIGTRDRFFIHGDWDLLNAVSDLGYTSDLLADPGLPDDYLTQKLTFQGPAFAGLADHQEKDALLLFGFFRKRLIDQLQRVGN